MKHAADVAACGGSSCKPIVAVQVLEHIDLQKQARVASFNYSTFLPDPTICTGTHSAGSSNISRQCVCCPLRLCRPPSQS